jgi:hypothetical protein
MFKVSCRLSPSLLVEVSANSAKDVIKDISFFSGLPTHCPRCSTPLHFFHRSPQNYDYYGLECEQGHTANFGQHQTGGTLFFKSDTPFLSREEALAQKPQNGNGAPQGYNQAPAGFAPFATQQPQYAPQQPPQGYAPQQAPPQQFAQQPPQGWPQNAPQQPQGPRPGYPPAPAPGVPQNAPQQPNRDDDLAF